MRRRLPIIITLLLAAQFAAASALAAETITFSEHIAPIIYDNCVGCHRPGEAAPFPLISFEDVKKRGALIATVTGSRFMPPWHAVHEYGEFAGERRLSDRQIASIAAWVQQGMAEGDRSRIPKLPQFSEGWQLGKPDLVLEMPVGFAIPASGPDLYRNFVIPTRLAEDKWIRAVEFRPGTRRVVHHAFFSYVRGGSVANIDGADGRPGFSGGAPIGLRQGVEPAGGLGGWALGNTPQFWPDGISMRLPKGSDFVLQLHLHPTGKAETEKSVIGIYFADKAPEREVVGIDMPALFAFGSGVDIQPGVKEYVLEDSITLPGDIRAFAVTAHAHYIAKEMKATATLPDGSTKPLLWIDKWDFNWQDTYLYKNQLLLPKGTRIDVRLIYDNSTDNPRNPNNPPQRVQWGERTIDEMGSIALLAVALRDEDHEAMRQLLGERTRNAVARGVKDGTAQRFLAAEIVSRAVAAGPRLSRITLVDREGRTVSTVGEPAAYAQPALSPDGSRVAVVKTDAESRRTDIWVIDVGSGAGTRITSETPQNSSPVWSPDGKQIAYSSPSGSNNTGVIYRRPADGSGTPVEVYRHVAGAGAILTDWSADNSIVFWAGKATYTVPANGGAAVALIPSDANIRGARISHDNRFVAYNSDESGRWELYAAPRDGSSKAIRISTEAAVGGIFWRADDKELLFLNSTPPTWMTVDVGTSPASPALSASEPKRLFQVPAPVNAPAQLSNIATPDAARFVLLMPVQPGPAR